MKYAIIRTGGKQYKINEGDIIDVERLPEAPEKKITFSEVLMVTDGDVVNLGFPLIANATVSGTVIDDIKGEKIRVAKFKAKARYRRVTGHRQALTRVQIDTISLGGTKKETKDAEKPKTDKKVTASDTAK